MKQLLQQYAAYNYWANLRLLECLAASDQALLNSETGGSFGTILKTMVHMWDAESIWWQRIKLAEYVIKPGDNFNAGLEELGRKLLKQSSDWEEWVKASNEAALVHVFSYQNTKKELFKQPVAEALMHLFNHQSYHRGQVICQLRNAGVEKIPSTDFIQFTRKKG